MVIVPTTVDPSPLTDSPRESISPSTVFTPKSRSPLVLDQRKAWSPNSTIGIDFSTEPNAADPTTIDPSLLRSAGVIGVFSDPRSITPLASVHLKARMSTNCPDPSNCRPIIPTMTDPSLLSASGRASVAPPGSGPTQFIPAATVQRKVWVSWAIPVTMLMRLESPTTTDPS